MRKPSPRELPAAESGRSPGPTGPLTACVIWANDYATGIANLGHQRVWELVDGRGPWSADRLYAADRPAGAPVSFAWGRPLGGFDLIILSLAFEGDYPAALELLDAAGLLHLGPDREGPLIIVGGIAPTLNPRPISPFVDAVYRGDAEAALPGLLTELAEAPLERAVARARFSDAGLHLEGADPAASSIHRWRSPTGVYAASRTISPHGHFGRTLLVELGRGCPRRCRFCAARWAAGGWRPADPAALLGLIDERAAELDVRKLGLVGTAVAESGRFLELLLKLEKRGYRAGSGSLRADLLTPEIAAALVRLGQRTLTLSAEAGSQRLRELLNKDLDEGDLLRAAEAAAGAGAARLKLYFIYGLPGETDDDLAAIIELAAAIKGRLGRTRLEISASPLVPKPLTPLADEPLLPEAELRRRRKMLVGGLARVGLTAFTGESPRQALWQAALSRGDGRLLRRLRAGESKGSLIRDALV